MNHIRIEITQTNGDSVHVRFTQNNNPYNPLPQNRTTSNGCVLAHVEQLKKLYRDWAQKGYSIEISARGDGVIEERIRNEPIKEPTKKRGRPRKIPPVPPETQTDTKQQQREDETDKIAPDLEWVALFRLYLNLRRPVIMIAGEPGIGKTTIALEVLRKEYKRDVIIVDGDSELTASFFLGHWTISNTDKGLQEIWHPGIIEQTIARSGILLINEADALNPSTLLKVVQSVGGNPLRPSYFSLHDGRVLDVSHYDITPLVLTANTFGEGGSIDYHRQQFDKASLDRISIVAAQSLPIDRMLKFIKWGDKQLNDEQIASMTKKLKQVRDGLKARQLDLSNRSIMRIGQLTLALAERMKGEQGFATAFRYALFSELQRHTNELSERELRNLVD